MVDRKLAHKATRVAQITTYANMTSDFSDLVLVIKPSSDLAIMNCLAREIVARGAVNMDFVNKHCVFATGPADIGYGMRPTVKFALDAEKDTVVKEMEVALDRYGAIGQRRKSGDKVAQKNRTAAGRHWLISFDEYKRGIEPYTPVHAGVSVRHAEAREDGRAGRARHAVLRAARRALLHVHRHSVRARVSDRLARLPNREVTDGRRRIAKRGAELALAGANDVCTGCHAPQAGVAPLAGHRSVQLRPQPFARYCAS